MKRIELTLIGWISVAVLFFGLIGGLLHYTKPLVFVRPGETGVIFSWGKITGKVYSAGAHWVGLFSSIEKMDTRIKTNWYRDAVKSSDAKPIYIMTTVMFRLIPESAPKLLEEVGNGDNALNNIIIPITSEVAKTAVLKYKQAEVLANRTEIEKEVASSLKERLLEYGIETKRVVVSDLDITFDGMQATPSVSHDHGDDSPQFKS